MEQNLLIDIHSFSYKKKGIPKDERSNGGGFVFDCRGILNPGRVPENMALTGNDLAVQKMLQDQTQMPVFLELVHQIISINIQNYLERGFENLQINFGCTGGQHRSVYAAIKTAEFVQKNFPMTKIQLTHDEQPQLNESK